MMDGNYRRDVVGGETPLRMGRALWIRVIFSTKVYY